MALPYNSDDLLLNLALEAKKFESYMLTAKGENSSQIAADGDTRGLSTTMKKVATITDLIRRVNSLFTNVDVGQFPCTSNFHFRESLDSEFVDIGNCDYQVKNDIRVHSFYSMFFVDSHPCVGPWTFYLAMKEDEELKTCMKSLPAKIQNGELSKFVFKPKPGSYVIASDGDRYFRALVMYAYSSGTCNLIDVDSGQIYQKPLGSLWHMDEDSSSVPCQAVSCCISGLPSKTPYWSMKISNFFRRTMEDYEYNVSVETIVHEQPVKCEVHLEAISTDCRFDFNKWVTSVLMPLLYRLGEQPNEEDYVYFDSLNPSVLYSNNDTDKDLPCKVELPLSSLSEEKKVVCPITFTPIPGQTHNVFLLKVSSPNEIYVHVVSSDCDEIDGMENNLNDYYSSHQVSFKSKSSLMMHCKDYCAVLYDNQWHRGKILDSVCEDNCLIKVFLVDHGLKLYIGFKFIQPLVDEFTTYPQCAILCRLAISPSEGEQEWSKKSIESVIAILNVERIYEMRIVAISETVDVPYVVLFCKEGYSKLDVCQHMIMNGLAEEKSFLREVKIPVVEESEVCPNSGVPIPDHHGTDSNAPGGKTSHSVLYPALPDDDGNLSSCSEDVYSEGTVVFSGFNSESLIPSVGSKVRVHIYELNNIRSYYGIINRTVGNLSTLMLLNQMNENIFKWVTLRKLKPLSSPSLGQVVVAQCREDGYWYRARILEHMEETDSALVFFLDYGSEEKVSMKNLREVNKVFLKLPFLAVKFFVSNIEGVPCKVLYDKLLVKCGELVGERFSAFIVNFLPDNEIHVRLFSDGGDDLGELMNQSVANGCKCHTPCKYKY